MTTISKRPVRTAAALLVASAVAETVLVRLGGTFGSIPQERAAALPGDDIVPRPDVVTDHAITFDAPPVRVALAGADGLAPRRLVHRAMGGPVALSRELAERDPDHAGDAGPAGG